MLPTAAERQRSNHGTIYRLDLRVEVFLVRGSNPEISASKQGVAVEVWVDAGSQVVFPLPLGI